MRYQWSSEERDSGGLLLLTSSHDKYHVPSWPGKSDTQEEYAGFFADRYTSRSSTSVASTAGGWEADFPGTVGSGSSASARLSATARHSAKPAPACSNERREMNCVV